MEWFDSLNEHKRKLYATTVFVSMIGSGCSIGFRESRDSNSEVKRLIRNDVTIIEKGIARKCLVHYLYPEDISKSYWAGADTVSILSCR